MVHRSIRWIPLRAVALVLFAAGQIACTTNWRDAQATPPSGAPEKAPRDVEDFVISFRDLPIIQNLDGTPSRKPHEQALAQPLADMISDAIRTAGGKVVSGDAAELQLAVRLKISCNSTMGECATMEGQLVAEVSGDGGKLETIEHRADVHAGGTSGTPTKTFFLHAARRIADRIVTARSVLASLRSRRGSAVASNASPATSSSQAASATTAPPLTLLSASPQPTAYALIVGIERYRDVPSPTGARQDAQRFAQLARQTLGIPESHVVLAIDDRASKGDIEKHLSWLKANVQPGGRIYFFFSGHGAPEPSSGTSYLLPYDGDPRSLDQTALTLGSVLKSLSDTRAKDVVAILDSCFSGAGGRSVLPPGARPLVRVRETSASARLALFTASSGSEISGPTPGGAGGLFTHYVTEGLGTGQADADGDGQVTMRELLDWVKPRVSREAKRDNRDQNPGLVLSSDLGDAGDLVLEWGIAKR